LIKQQKINLKKAKLFHNKFLYFYAKYPGKFFWLLPMCWWKPENLKYLHGCTW